MPNRDNEKYGRLKGFYINLETGIAGLPITIETGVSGRNNGDIISSRKREIYKALRDILWLNTSAEIREVK